jgi:hypothetical protein
MSLSLMCKLILSQFLYSFCIQYPGRGNGEIYKESFLDPGKTLLISIISALYRPKLNDSFAVMDPNVYTISIEMQTPSEEGASPSEEGASI